MGLAFDHLVVASRSLAEGVAWIEARAGSEMGPGGKHAAMGTHNRLLSLGPGRFLEVIAIDPEASAPDRARWFDLDAAHMRARLEAGPALIHWVARSDDLDAALDALAGARPEVLSLRRGDYRWRIGVPRDGSLASAGAHPTVIQWEGRHPADTLPDVGCRLESLTLRHPQSKALLQSLARAGLEEPEIGADPQGAGISARIRVPGGIVELSQ